MNQAKATRIPASTDRLVRLRPDHSFWTGRSGENALARFGIGHRKAANGDLEITFYFLFDLARAIPVREGETAVDFRFRRILRSKKFVKLFLTLNRAGIGITK